MRARNYGFGDKWPDNVRNNGYVMTPKTLMERIRVLDLTSSQVVILVCLIMHEWEKGSSRPSIGRLSDYTGMAKKTVSANLLKLQNKGLIMRIFQEGLPSHYDLSPLADKLDKFPKYKYNPPQKQGHPGSDSSTLDASKMRTNRNSCMNKQKRPNVSSGKVESTDSIIARTYGRRLL